MAETSQNADEKNTGQHKAIRRLILSLIIGYAPLGVSVLASPLFLRSIGVDSFGLISLFYSLTLLCTIPIIGISSQITCYVTAHGKDELLGKWFFVNKEKLIVLTLPLPIISLAALNLNTNLSPTTLGFVFFAFFIKPWVDVFNGLNLIQNRYFLTAIKTALLSALTMLNAVLSTYHKNFQETLIIISILYILDGLASLYIYARTPSIGISTNNKAPTFHFFDSPYFRNGAIWLLLTNIDKTMVSWSNPQLLGAYCVTASLSSMLAILGQALQNNIMSDKSTHKRHLWLIQVTRLTFLIVLATLFTEYIAKDFISIWTGALPTESLLALLPIGLFCGASQALVSIIASKLVIQNDGNLFKKSFYLMLCVHGTATVSLTYISPACYLYLLTLANIIWAGFFLKSEFPYFFTLKKQLKNLIKSVCILCTGLYVINTLFNINQVIFVILSTIYFCLTALYFIKKSYH